MPPPGPAILYTSETDIVSLLSQEGVTLRIDDNRNTLVQAPETAWVPQAINLGTARCNKYLMNRYEPEKLALSWTVWDAATVFGSEWLCGRRGNPVPKTIQRWSDNAQRYFELVQERKRHIEEIAERTIDSISWRNTIVDPFYRNQQVRVQVYQSERTPPQLAVRMDYLDAIIQEP